MTGAEAALEAVEQWAGNAASRGRLELLLVGGSFATGECQSLVSAEGSDLDAFLWCHRRYRRALSGELSDLLAPVPVHVFWVGSHRWQPLRANFGTVLAGRAGVVIPRGQRLHPDAVPSPQDISDHEAQRLLWNRLSPFLLSWLAGDPSPLLATRLAADIGTLLLFEVGVFELSYSARAKALAGRFHELAPYGEVRSVALAALTARGKRELLVGDDYSTATLTAAAQYLSTSPLMRRTTRRGILEYLRGWGRVLSSSKYLPVFRYWWTLGRCLQHPRSTSMQKVFTLARRMAAAEETHRLSPSGARPAVANAGLQYWICENPDG